MYPDSVETAEYASPPSSQVAAEDWVHSLVQEESNLPEWNDSTLDGISDSEIDDVFVELPNEDCLGSEMAGGMDSEVTLSGALQPEDNSGYLQTARYRKHGVGVRVIIFRPTKRKTLETKANRP